MHEAATPSKQWSHGLDGRWSGAKPRVFWRGSTPGDTRRIRTGNETWDSYLFVSSIPDFARDYGSHLERIDAKPNARILYDGTREFQRLAKGLKGTLLLVSAAVVERARKEGYDAVWFRMQGNVGTVIINPQAFVRNLVSIEPERAVHNSTKSEIG